MLRVSFHNVSGPMDCTQDTHRKFAVRTRINSTALHRSFSRKGHLSDTVFVLFCKVSVHAPSVGTFEIRWVRSGLSRAIRLRRSRSSLALSSCCLPTSTLCAQLSCRSRALGRGGCSHPPIRENAESAPQLLAASGDTPEAICACCFCLPRVRGRLTLATIRSSSRNCMTPRGIRSK